MSDFSSETSLGSIAVTGAGGMLGSEVVNELLRRNVPVKALVRAACDVTSLNACRKAFSVLRPSVVINCAAFTDVNRAESEPNRAMALNGTGTYNVAKACMEYDARLIHVSTDYIFDGTKVEPYDVGDEPNPLNVYGQSKLAGEKAVAEVMTEGTWTIARTSWLFGSHGPNFAKTMLRLAREGKPLKVINDQTGAPTYAVDLAKTLYNLAFVSPTGIVHATARGGCTWYDFAREIFRLSQVYPPSLESCSSDSFPTPARRPANSLLSADSLKSIGIDPLPEWHDGLRRYLEKMGELRA